MKPRAEMSAEEFKGRVRQAIWARTKYASWQYPRGVEKEISKAFIRNTPPGLAAQKIVEKFWPEVAP